MTARRTQTLQISELPNLSQSRLVPAQEIGLHLILRLLLSLVIHFVPFGAVANSSNGSFCVVKDMALFQTTGWVISTPISASELVSAIVALRVMAGRVGQLVREAMW
jgi:hypothetical protein